MRTRIVSGAGDFDTRILKVLKEDRNIVMVGKMGYWEVKMYLSPKEALSLAKNMFIPLIKSIIKR